MPGHVARSLGACCSRVYGTALLFTHTCLAASYCPVLKKKDCPLFLKKEVAECFHQTAPRQYRTGQLGSKGRVRDRAAPSPAWPHPAAPSQKGRARMGMVTRGAQPSSVCPQVHAAGGNTTTTSWCSGRPDSTGPSLSWTAPAQQSQHMPAGSSTAQSPEEPCVNILQHSSSK